MPSVQRKVSFAPMIFQRKDSTKHNSSNLPLLEIHSADDDELSQNFDTLPPSSRINADLVHDMTNKSSNEPLVEFLDDDVTPERNSRKKQP